MARNCGGCTQCCKNMAVQEINKPGDVWCPQCTIGRGCKVYATRPQSCQDFKCLWLEDESFPEELRPDRSKVVLQANIEGTAICAYIDPKQEKSWRQGAMGKVLRKIASVIPIIIVCGDKRKMIATDKAAERGEMLLHETGLDGKVTDFVPVRSIR